MAKILIADDDLELLDLLKQVLEKDGHIIYTATNGTEAKRMALEQPELILLDVMMPEMDGFQVCRLIRDNVDCPILFITAKSSVEDTVLGLGVGGDDYIIKPFRIVELRARVEAHLRREKREKLHRLIIENVAFDITASETYIEDKKVPLTPSEYKISELLATHKGQVFSKDQIYEKIWGFDSEGFSSTVTEHIRNIRRKFQEYKSKSNIETVWGIGYKWEVKK
ncbi:DNA-binding response regulator [Clostridiaceae bacterium 14S0207]|nr:DNA-binding response regulator [Clostridiaceae bacterium 14S0207]